MYRMLVSFIFMTSENSNIISFSFYLNNFFSIIVRMSGEYALRQHSRKCGCKVATEKQQVQANERGSQRTRQ